MTISSTAQQVLCLNLVNRELIYNKGLLLTFNMALNLFNFCWIRSLEPILSVSYPIIDNFSRKIE